MAALERLKAKEKAHVLSRAKQAQDIAIRLHTEAPRGGVNINAFGEHRSAPGEPPAIEFGNLLEAILEPPREIGPMAYQITVNRVGLEWGVNSDNLEPRPMGRMTLDELKAEVR